MMFALRGFGSLPSPKAEPKKINALFCYPLIAKKCAGYKAAVYEKQLLSALNTECNLYINTEAN